MEPFRPDLLAGKTTLITGGGTGLGRSMALRLAGLGARVAVVGRRPEPLQEVADRVRAAGGRAAATPCDVRDPEAVEAALSRVEDELGPLNQLVNNAAGNFLCASEDLSPNAFDSVVRIVLYGSVYCTLALGRRLIQRKQKGEILSIATTYAETGSAFVLPSATAKAGVLAMTRSLAVEWAAYGIRLNAVAPGPFPTEGAWARLNAQKNRANLEKLVKWAAEGKISSHVDRTFPLAQTADALKVLAGRKAMGKVILHP